MSVGVDPKNPTSPAPPTLRSAAAPPFARPAPSAPPETSTAAAPSRRGLTMLVVLSVLAILGIGFGVHQYLYAQHHASTDDAQVEGHIIPVLPKVSGFVQSVNVIENQPVKAGDVLVRL